MPRQSRIDAPGALHHIPCQGMEQHRIFEDDEDRDNFVKRLGSILSETKTSCYAWAIIPNTFICYSEPEKHPSARSCGDF